MKAIKKEFYMEINKTKSRFISILIIVALGVAFFAGICSTEPDMRLSADKFYDDGNLMDIRVLSLTGITDEDIRTIEAIDGVEYVAEAYQGDFMNKVGDKEGVVTLQSYTEGVNEPILSEGRLPEGTGECIVEADYAEDYNLKTGDSITLSSGTDIPIEMLLEQNTFTITGIYTTPYYIGMDRGTTNIGNGKIDGVLMVNKEVFLQPVNEEMLMMFLQSVRNFCYILVEGAKEERAYTDEYNDRVEKVEEKIREYTDGPESVYYVTDRNQIQTYAEFDQDAERIGNIGKVVPVIFFLVAALVSLTTMTRMVEEQRTQIGTLKALGYTKSEVAGKYIKYALFASVTGSLLGGIAGSVILPRVIINAYRILYRIDTILTPVNGFYFVSACVIAVVLVTAATVFSCYRELMDKPAALMRPEPPKKTKKVLLERVPFLWKRISFSGKSTIRNLVRYKKRLFMTLFGISGCMALLVVGYGIKDSISSVVSIQYDELHKYDLILSLKNDITADELKAVEKKLGEDENVSDYLPLKHSSITIEKDGSSIGGYVYVAEDGEVFENFIRLRDRNTKESFRLEKDSVVISEKTADKLDIKEGDEIELVFGETERYTVKVSRITENYVYHNVYMTRELYEQVIGDVSMNQLLISLTEDGKEKEEGVAGEYLQTAGVGGASYIDKMREHFEDMLGNMDVIVAVVIVAAAGLAFVVLYNLNNININERRRELATLKVLGFYDLEVSRYIYRENVIITLLGIVAGAGLGIVLHRFVIITAEVDMVMFGRNVYPLSFVLSALLTALFAVLINISMHYKIKKVDMATSLKSVE